MMATYHVKDAMFPYPLPVTILFLRHFLKLNLILFFLNYESLTVDKLTNRAHNAREYN
jgi:hypothetical protein